MPCLVKDSRNRSPYWICAYNIGDRRVKKSTKQTDKKKAWEVCLAYVNAESAIASGSFSEQQMRKVIDDTLIKLGEKKLSDQTVRQLLNAWIDSKTGATATSTLKAYQQARDLLLEFLGSRADRTLRALQKGDVVQFRDHLLAQGRTAETVNKLFKKYLSAPFESARKEGLVEYNVFAVVDALKTTKVTKDRFTPHQVASIVQACKGKDWEGATLVGYTSGMRLVDVANLRWSAIDLEHGLLVFHEKKNNRELIIGLHPDLEEWISGRPAPDDPEAPLFPSLSGRRCNGDYGLSNSFIKIMKKAGIEGRVLRSGGPNARTVRSLSFHSFRHGAATAVFNRAALKEITRRVTGHAARGSVDKYIHEDLDVIREATKLIPRLPKA